MLLYECVIVGVCEFDLKLEVLILWGADVHQMATNGDHASTKPPPSPSPLRNAKFFQVTYPVN